MTEREEPPKTEDQIRYEALSNNVVKYLDVAKSTRNTRLSEESRAALRHRQIRIMQEEFDDADMAELLGYLTWRQEQLRPDTQATSPRIFAMPSTAAKPKP